VSLIINIETATDVCSVCLSDKENILCLLEDNSGQSHARLLTSLVDECVKEAGTSLREIDAIAVSTGPGSFTGLRIGVAAAKGFCYALDIPLLSVNTLHSLAKVFLKSHQTASTYLLCPMLDARRMEVYTTLLDSDLNEFMPTQAKILDENSFSDILNNQYIAFFGNGSDKAKKLLENNSNALFFNNLNASSSGMPVISSLKFIAGKFENIETFEPFYLKDFYSPGLKIS